MYMCNVCVCICIYCGALAKLRNCVGIDILKNVYHALVHSYLRYGILVWGHATKSVLKSNCSNETVGRVIKISEVPL